MALQVGVVVTGVLAVRTTVPTSSGHLQRRRLAFVDGVATPRGQLDIDPGGDPADDPGDVVDDSRSTGLANRGLDDNAIVVGATVTIADVTVDGVAVVGFISAQATLKGGAWSVGRVVLYDGRLALVLEVATAALVDAGVAARRRGRSTGGQERR